MIAPNVLKKSLYRDPRCCPRSLAPDLDPRCHYRATFDSQTFRFCCRPCSFELFTHATGPKSGSSPMKYELSFQFGLGLYTYLPLYLSKGETVEGWINLTIRFLLNSATCPAILPAAALSRRKYDAAFEN